MHRTIPVLVFLLLASILTGCQGGLLERAARDGLGQSILERLPSATAVTTSASTPAGQEGLVKVEPPVDTPAIQATALEPSTVPVEAPAVAVQPTAIPPTETSMAVSPTLEATPPNGVVPEGEDCQCKRATRSDALHQGVAALLGVAPGMVQIMEIETAQWPDSCLGLAGSGESCAQVITPGYRITVQVGEQRYQLRSDGLGQQVRLEARPLPTALPFAETPSVTTENLNPAEVTAATETPTPPPEVSPTATPAQPVATQTGFLPQVVLEGLARQLRVQPSQVILRDWQENTWPDACFDFLRPQPTACPAIPTKGYEGVLALSKVIFGGDPAFIFRTTENGAPVYLLPIAAQEVRQVLAAQNGVEPQAVELLKVENWPWPDTCAYLALPFPENTICIKVPLPGWRVVARLGDQTFEFHTDLNGEVIR